MIHFFHHSKNIPGNDATGPLRNALITEIVQRTTALSPTVAAAMRTVPRHLFVPTTNIQQVYTDAVIATKWGEDGIPISSASQPTMVALMLDQLAITEGMNILEIGAGTGYNAALLATLAGPTGHVTTIDVDEDIATAARQHLTNAGLDDERVTVLCQDGVNGDITHAPFDRIVLTVGAWDVAPAWFDQLRDGGRLVLPLAIQTMQFSIGWDKHGTILQKDSIIPCGFMRLRGSFTGAEKTLMLPGMEGTRLLLEGVPLPSLGIIAALFHTLPRITSININQAEELRSLLVFTGNNVASFTSANQHPQLGIHAVGIILPEGDSACFVAIVDDVAALVEYGLPKAGHQMAIMLASLAERPPAPLRQWPLSMVPITTEIGAVATTRSIFLPKHHWIIQGNIPDRAQPEAKMV